MENKELATLLKMETKEQKVTSSFTIKESDFAKMKKLAKKYTGGNMSKLIVYGVLFNPNFKLK